MRTEITVSLRIVFLSDDVTWLFSKEGINMLCENRPKTCSLGWF